MQHTNKNNIYTSKNRNSNHIFGMKTLKSVILNKATRVKYAWKVKVYLYPVT